MKRLPRGGKPGGRADVPYTHEFEVDGEWKFREIEFEFTVEAFIPGRYFGPPEDCYPDEGGDVELVDVRDCNGAQISIRSQWDETKKKSYSIIHWTNGEAPDCIIDDDTMNSLEVDATERVAEQDDYEPPEPDYEDYGY